MKLVTLTWKRIRQLGEKPFCAAINCNRILYAGEQIYCTQGGRHGHIINYFCRHCIEHKHYIIYPMKIFLRHVEKQAINGIL